MIKEIELNNIDNKYFVRKIYIWKISIFIFIVCTCMSIFSCKYYVNCKGNYTTLSVIENLFRLLLLVAVLTILQIVRLKPIHKSLQLTVVMTFVERSKKANNPQLGS